MTKIKVAQDEWFVWVPVTGSSFDKELDVDPETAKRWRRAVKDFNDATSEIAALIHESKEEHG